MAKTLTSWKPGQSGNVRGRPLESWAEALRIVSEKVDKNSGKKYKELVSEILWKRAIRGNLSAIKVLMDRMEGTPKQTAEVISKSLPIPILGGLTGIAPDRQEEYRSRLDSLMEEFDSD